MCMHAHTHTFSCKINKKCNVIKKNFSKARMKRVCGTMRMTWPSYLERRASEVVQIRPQGSWGIVCLPFLRDSGTLSGSETFRLFCLSLYNPLRVKEA